MGLICLEATFDFQTWVLPRCSRLNVSRCRYTRWKRAFLRLIGRSVPRSLSPHLSLVPRHSSQNLSYNGQSLPTTPSSTTDAAIDPRHVLFRQTPFPIHTSIISYTWLGLRRFET